MQVDLSKEDIIYLLKGVDVASYSLVEVYQRRGYGKMWAGGHSEKWEWNITTLKQLADNTLWALYLENKPKRAL